MEIKKEILCVLAFSEALATHPDQERVHKVSVIPRIQDEGQPL